MELFRTANRDESHRALEYANGQRKVDGVDKDFPGTEKLAKKVYSHAECREDPNDKSKKPYAVFSGPKKDKG